MLIELYKKFASRVRDNQELVASESRIQHIAYHDPLTGLANRLFLGELLERTLMDLRDHGRAFAFICVDLDRFKEVNDTFGHATGDELIRVAARLLLDECGPLDVLARLGGDEFAIIRPDTTMDDAADLAARLVRAFTNPIDLALGRVFIGGSVGVCLVEDPINATECLRRADMALYEAKDQGRGQYAFFEPHMDAALHMRVQTRDDLRAALVRGDLTLVYQPQLQDGKIYGVEALARWNHPQRGPISPEAFVPIAEESGLIDELGKFVLRQAFTDSHQLGELRIGVNVSATQIRNREFAGLLRQLLQETGADPTRIELEITEGVLLGDDPEIRNTLEQVRTLGFRIALDDFGTGYSSLSYLRDYPIDKIKIDRSFITSLGQDKGADAVVGAIIRLARALDLDVIAEGVETETQRIRLAALGCGDIQGFLLGRPSPLSAIINTLRMAA